MTSLVARMTTRRSLRPLILALSIALAGLCPAVPKAAAQANPDAPPASTVSVGRSEAEADSLHAAYGRLLHRYVVGLGVDYPAWVVHGSDVASLEQYIRNLASLDPTDWDPANGLAYWINLYNGLTLRLILENYPLKSIKDIGGFLKKSPWKRKVVTIAGRTLTLDQIENEILRPTYRDPRVHFALNCASVGCPPLSNAAYRAGTISGQLDQSCARALNHERWVRVDAEGIQVTKIFDWYGDDFTGNGGSVRSFIDRHRTEPLPEGEIHFMSYDWSLNLAK